MELTKGKVDFYSHHFYELASNNTYKEQWNGHDSYAQGIMECTLDLWDDYNGKRVASSSNHRKIFTHAVIDGDALKIALNNRSDRRTSINLSVALPRGVKVVSATRKMPIFEKGEMTFVEEPLKDLSAVDVGVEVTELVYLKLSRTPELSVTRNETAWYSPDTAVQASSSTEFKIRISRKELARKRKRAVLRLGLHRAGGFEKGVSALVNGKAVGRIDLAYSKGAFISSVKVRLITE